MNSPLKFANFMRNVICFQLHSQQHTAAKYDDANNQLFVIHIAEQCQNIQALRITLFLPDHSELAGCMYSEYFYIYRITRHMFIFIKINVFPNITHILNYL